MPFLEGLEREGGLQDIPEALASPLPFRGAHRGTGLKGEECKTLGLPEGLWRFPVAAGRRKAAVGAPSI